ncbi:exo-alpha-sialidase, partial [bacterium]|nr:exo-alpha-sialidase [bacterium]
MTRHILWDARENGVSWFHPRAGVVPGSRESEVVMTLQSVSGSDYFGPVHATRSVDNGQSWTDPERIAALGRIELPGGLQEGVCDVVPEYHAKTNTVLAIGHNVYYKDGKLTLPDRMRHPTYVVRDRNGHWGERWKLAWDDPRGSAMYTSGCAQRIHLENGDILLPLSFNPLDHTDRMVGSVRCEFNGSRLEISETGNALELKVDRGLLEPSLVKFKNLFYMTIRAEDDRGYFSVSADGLQWDDLRPWCWDDGTPLTMSTTQQHWLAHSDAVFLVYTRKSEINPDVVRWRAPLYAARFDTDRGCLIRETEQVIQPLVGDGIHAPKQVPLLGNFHVTAISETESWVTVGENMGIAGWLPGKTWLTRLFWETPNSLAPYNTEI